MGRAEIMVVVRGVKKTGSTNSETSTREKKQRKKHKGNDLEVMKWQTGIVLKRI